MFQTRASVQRLWAMACLAVVAICSATPSSNAAGAPQITEFQIPPPAAFPQLITRGPDGAMWLTLAQQSAVARVNTAGEVTQFPLPNSGAFPLGITAGPDGNVWFTERNGNQIGRITPSGSLTEFGVPTASSQPYEITAGPDGALWFTELGANKIGRITVQGNITEFILPTPGAAPQGIAAGPDGAIWFTELAGNRIGRVTTAGAITEFPLPTASAGPGSIASGPDGNLWFTEYFANQIGRITPTGIITEFPIPTPDSEPVAITAWPKGGALWFTEFNASQLGRISTDGVISEFATPTAASSPSGIAPGPESQGSVWFTEASANKVARLMEPLPPALTEPVAPGGGPRGVAAEPLTLEELNAKDPPTLGKDVNVGPRKGQIFISVPVGRGASARASRTVPGIKGRRFVPLTEARQIPVGSLLDTRRGTIRVASASTRAHKPYLGDFSAGVFQVLQSRKSEAKGLTELRLKGSSFARCGAGKPSVARSTRSRRTIRRLRGNAKGRFRTRGRYSAATVRGTVWTTTDHCDGTLTAVTRGKVAVRDFRRKRSILVRQGKRYLAAAPR